MKLPEGLVRDLRRMNPWWENNPMQVLPNTKRHLVGMIKKRMEKKLAAIVVVRGPRQIGKTTAQLHVIQDLLDQKIEPERIFRIQTDELPELTKLSEPILRLVDWYEDNILNMKLNEAARKGKSAFVFFDEVQNLKDWAPQLKTLVDHSTLQVLVTGSSALRIELGRDSLAGRINTIEAGTLSLTEIGLFHSLSMDQPYLQDNGLEPLLSKGFWEGLVKHGIRLKMERDKAFKWFSDRGAYPLAQQKTNAEWGQIADQLNETVIQRVIEHDLRIGDRGRKRDASLLEEIFRLSCRYIGQTPNLSTLARETQRTLNANIGPQRVDHYLRFLGDTLLLRLIPPLEIRLKRKKSVYKICLADHGLRASWLQEVIPLDPNDLNQEPHLSVLAGHVAESVIGAVLSTIAGLDIAHLPERGGEPEVDFVMTIGTKRIPVEVKYQKRIDALNDTEGLRTFIENKNNRAAFGILVTQNDLQPLDDPRIVAMPLSTFMLIR